MGGATSVESEVFTKAQAQELAGEHWDEAAFDAKAVNGVVTKSDWNAARSAFDRIKVAGKIAPHTDGGLTVDALKKLGAEGFRGN